MKGIPLQDKQSTAILWHKKMGHRSEQGLIELKRQYVLGDLKSIGTGSCEHCVLWKAHRVKFTRSKHQSQGILDYAHVDLWGPARTQSLGGAMYFLSLVDDFSRRVWVYDLKNKYETFERFEEWKAMVEISLKEG
jgi:hypothetical protein